VATPENATKPFQFQIFAIVCKELEMTREVGIEGHGDARKDECCLTTPVYEALVSIKSSPTNR
jgi:hypothetical protein